MRLVSLIAVLLVAPACAGAQARAPATVDAAYQAALQRSPTPLSLRRDQAEYLRERGQTRDAELIAGIDEDRLERLMRTAEIDLMGSTSAATLEELTEGCLDLGAVDGCGAVQGGWLSDGEDHRLFWQVQAGSTGADGITGGIVLMEERRGRLDAAAWAFQGSSYEAPVLFEADGATYVAVPGRTFGAGRGDADLIFRWTPGAQKPLTQIDSWSWRDQLAQQLPGLNAFGRVRIDYEEMIALTEMFRDTDPGCCGTGGHALIDFAIEGDRLVVTEARLRDR